MKTFRKPFRTRTEPRPGAAAARRMTAVFRFAIPLCLGLLLAAAAPLSAAEPSFLRLDRSDAGEPRALQVAVATYRSSAGVELDVVGAVHVADRGYFEALDVRFDGYDRVLYELVGEPGRATAPASAAPSLISMLQGGMKDAMGLAFQLDEIDYDRPHFVHADMTGTEFRDSMRDRNESMASQFMKAWAKGMAEQARGNLAGSELGLLRVLLADDRQLALKRMMADQLADQLILIDALSDETGSTLITERNRKALAVLDAEIESGAKNLALFYGAGHLPDFHKRLVDGRGFELVGIEWLDAWDLMP